MKDLNCKIKAPCGDKLCCYSCKIRENCKKACLNSPDRCSCSIVKEIKKKEGVGDAK